DEHVVTGLVDQANELRRLCQREPAQREEERVTAPAIAQVARGAQVRLDGVDRAHRATPHLTEQEGASGVEAGQLGQSRTESVGALHTVTVAETLNFPAANAEVNG